MAHAKTSVAEECQTCNQYGDDGKNHERHTAILVLSLLLRCDLSRVSDFCHLKIGSYGQHFLMKVGELLSSKLCMAKPTDFCFGLDALCAPRTI